MRHHEEDQAIGDAGIEQRKDVRVGKAGREGDFLFEALGAEGVREVGPDHLDRDASAVARVVGQEDDRHPAMSDLADESV